jgi:hypothetical protein
MTTTAKPTRTRPPVDVHARAVAYFAAAWAYPAERPSAVAGAFVLLGVWYGIRSLCQLATWVRHG